MTKEQIQALKDNKVSDPYYLVECCNCGEMYPSNKLSGGGQIADTGDYGDCYCPHCDASEDYEDLGNGAAEAWNYQQKKIDTLLADREADKALIARLLPPSRNILLPALDNMSREGLLDVIQTAVDNYAAMHAEYESRGQRIAELEARTLTIKLPEPLMPAQHNSGELFMTPDNIEQGGYLNRDDVLRALRKACAAAGITLVVGGEDATNSR